MAEQYAPNLGGKPGENARRDAVHIAVAPVVAEERLVPGWHVGLLENGRAGVVGTLHLIGIVDPFLAEVVEEGQHFWLFLYPGTVTSLRHVWTHPAFAPMTRKELP